MTAPLPAPNREPLSLAVLVDDWGQIVGPELAAVVAFEGFDRRGELAVSVVRRADPSVVEALALQLRERLPSAVDGIMISRIRWVRRHEDAGDRR